MVFAMFWTAIHHCARSVLVLLAPTRTSTETRSQSFLFAVCSATRQFRNRRNKSRNRWEIKAPFDDTICLTIGCFLYVLYSSVDGFCQLLCCGNTF
uniref:Secreted protein n=1 Tax=Rhizophora mucronata TaxID=61149 RepID=A0A2P2JCJ8_RHIMU